MMRDLDLLKVDVDGSDRSFESSRHASRQFGGPSGLGVQNEPNIVPRAMTAIKASTALTIPTMMMSK